MNENLENYTTLVPEKQHHKEYEVTIECLIFINVSAVAHNVSIFVELIFSSSSSFSSFMFS
jgi:hypothetical protein